MNYDSQTSYLHQGYTVQQSSLTHILAFCIGFPETLTLTSSCSLLLLSRDSFRMSWERAPIILSHKMAHILV